MKTWTSGSVSEPVLGSRAGEGRSPVTIHQWKILCSHMLPLKAASFPHFASRWGCLKRAGRVLKALINRGTSNMFGKDLHFHPGTLNYYNTPTPSSTPPLPKLLTVGSLAVFLLPDILKSCVTAVNWPPLYDNGGEKMPHLQKSDMSQSSLVSGRAPALNERRRRRTAGRAKQSDGTFYLMVMDGEGAAAFR